MLLIDFIQGKKSDASNKAAARITAENLAKPDASLKLDKNPGIWVPITNEFKDFSVDDKKLVIDYLTNHAITGTDETAIKQKAIASEFINNADVYFTKAKPNENFDSYVVEQGDTKLNTQLISEQTNRFRIFKTKNYD